MLQDEINRLQALEMWLWRELEKISWKDKIRNDEVLAMLNEERCLIRTITQRKELDRTCTKRKWVIEGYDGRENDG